MFLYTSISIVFFWCVFAIIYINCITHMYTYYGMQHLLSFMHCLGISQTKWTFTYMENHPTKNIRCFKEGNLFAWCLIWL